MSDTHLGLRQHDEQWWLASPRPLEFGGFFDAWAVTVRGLTVPYLHDSSRATARWTHDTCAASDEWCEVAATTLYALSHALGPRSSLAGARLVDGRPVLRDDAHLRGRHELAELLYRTAGLRNPGRDELVHVDLGDETCVLLVAGVHDPVSGLHVVQSIADPRRRVTCVLDALCTVAWLAESEWSPRWNPQWTTDVLRLAVRVVADEMTHDWQLALDTALDSLG